MFIQCDERLNIVIQPEDFTADQCQHEIIGFMIYRYEVMPLSNAHLPESALICRTMKSVTFFIIPDRYAFIGH